MPSLFAEGPEFRALLRGEPADLTRLALEIAKDAYPDLDPLQYLRRMDDLAERVRDRCPDQARVRQILSQINWVLFVEEGFRGNTEDYYDARNSYLNDVIERRTGIPISLSVLYMAIAERLGLEVSGVNLPAHFVIRTGHGDSTVFIDPFHAGAFLDGRGCEVRVEGATGQAVSLSDEQLAPCSTATIVVRMLRNLKATYLRQEQFLSAVPVLQRIVALLPNDAAEHRDLGVTLLHAGQPGEAIDHLRAYLDRQPDAEDAETVAAILKVAWREVAASN